MTDLVALPPNGHQLAAASVPAHRRGLWASAGREFVRDRTAVAAGVVLVVFVLFCIVVPFVSSADPNAIKLTEAYDGPTWAHPFGTDNFGRDLFTRTALGGRISLGIGLCATIVIVLVGGTYGAISGYVGGALDNAMMRILDALYGLPFLPFAIIALAIVGDVNFWSMVLALSIASWFTTARIMRGQVLSVKQSLFVTAARATGVSRAGILGRHVVPNTAGVVLVAVLLDLPGVILGEAFLSFIGLGINPPDASLGSMAQEGYESYRSHPHMMLVPSLSITLIVLCATFIADGTRRALDPRSNLL